MSELWHEGAVGGIGPRAVWARRKEWTGVLCSRRVPAGLVLAAQDWTNATCRSAARAGIQPILVSGWHSPLEQEIFRIARREGAFLVGVATRELAGARLPRVWRDAISDGAMTVVSPFADAERLSQDKAIKRARWIVENCPRVVVPHAAPDGILHALLLDVLENFGAPRIEVLPHPTHAELLEADAHGVTE